MTIDLKKFEKLKSELEHQREEVDRARGGLDHLMGVLKEDYSCETVEDAESVLQEMKDELSGLESTYEKELVKLQDAMDKVKGDEK